MQGQVTYLRLKSDLNQSVSIAAICLGVRVDYTDIDLLWALSANNNLIAIISINPRASVATLIAICDSVIDSNSLVLYTC